MNFYHATFWCKQAISLITKDNFFKGCQHGTLNRPHNTWTEMDAGFVAFYFVRLAAENFYISNHFLQEPFGDTQSASITRIRV